MQILKSRSGQMSCPASYAVLKSRFPGSKLEALAKKCLIILLSFLSVRSLFENDTSQKDSTEAGFDDGEETEEQKLNERGVS